MYTESVFQLTFGKKYSKNKKCNFIKNLSKCKAKNSKSVLWKSWKSNNNINDACGEREGENMHVEGFFFFFPKNEI